MQRKILSGLTSLMTAVAICQLSGCGIIVGSSCVGLGIGAISDASKPNHVTISSKKLASIKHGTTVDIILESGARLVGKYSGLIRVHAEEYAESYAKCREQNQEEIILPALGESVTIITELGKQYEGEFLGFGYGAVWLRRIERTESSKWNIKGIRNIVDSHGNIIEVETIRKLMSEGKIPIVSAIVLQTKIGKTQVAIEDVYEIQVKVKKKGKITGIVLGASVGLAMYLLAAVGFSVGSL